MVLPGVYIDVKPEGLIVPGRVTVGNLGVVGTAGKGPIGQPILVGSYAEARQVFGSYDAWDEGNGELTLTRALEIAYTHGANTVFAVRVASGTAEKASLTLKSASGDCATLLAKSEGTWGNDLSVKVEDAKDSAFIESEEHTIPSPVAAPKLSFKPIPSSRNRIRLTSTTDGQTRSLKIISDPAAPGPGEVKINFSTGDLTFGDPLVTGDKVVVSYLVGSSNAVRVTLLHADAKEVYTVASGEDLVADINRLSAWVTAEPQANVGELPQKTTAEPLKLKGGDNGALDADYSAGLEKLLESDVQIVLAAGQDSSFADELDAHCQVASSDEIKRDRISVVGSAAGADFDKVLDASFNIASDRVIFVAPGIKFNDAAASPPKEVTLSGAYAAAAVAGLLSSLPAHVSPTNKTLRVGDVAQRYTSPQLTQLVKNRVLALETRQGVRIVRGVTTSTNTAWTQITTRRIVDYAKYGVRSAASPYIGLLNNDRVRGALRSTVNSFLAEMVTDEMLVSYDLNVSATREQERQGIVQVNLILRPTFSIDYIKVTMFLE